MRPIIIYSQEQPSDNTKITLSKKDFETYINEAYEQGKQDGTITFNPTITSPNSPQIPTPAYPPTIICKTAELSNEHDERPIKY